MIFPLLAVDVKDVARAFVHGASPLLPMQSYLNAPAAATEPPLVVFSHLVTIQSTDSKRFNYGPIRA
jgi:hypothetical protein